MGQDPREARKATRSWFKSDPEWRTEEGEKQGWVQTSLTEGQESSAKVAARNILLLPGTGLPLNPCHSPWQEQPVGSVTSIKMWPRKSGNSGWRAHGALLPAVPALRGTFSWPAQTTLCSTPHGHKGKLLHSSHVPLFLKEILNKFNNLNFEKGGL